MLLDTLKFILSGLAVTLAVTATALPIGLILGVFFAILHVYGNKVFSRLAAIYSLVMRSIPAVVLLFILYFVIAGTLNISAFWAGSLSLGIISSAYQLEVFRGAILAVSGGQMVAARAVGMTRLQAIRHIILPQAFRFSIPPWTNEVATLIKDTSFVYALGVPEILRRAQWVGARTYKSLLAFSLAALIYFVLIFLTNRILGYVEEKTRIPAH